MANPDVASSEVRKADPAARRNAVVLILIGALIGSSLLVAFERYRGAVQEWLVAEPAQISQRLHWTLAFGGVALVLPLLVVAIYLWLVGTRTIRAGQFPPPDAGVVRDTPLEQGGTAALRGRGLQILAVCLAVAAVLLCVMLWRMAMLISATI
jgi:hypothetical protein